MTVNVTALILIFIDAGRGYDCWRSVRHRVADMGVACAEDRSLRWRRAHAGAGAPAFPYGRAVHPRRVCSLPSGGTTSKPQDYRAPTAASPSQTPRHTATTYGSTAFLAHSYFYPTPTTSFHVGQLRFIAAFSLTTPT